MVGEFARSKAGHDKGRLYIIIEEDEQFAYLSDGDLRKLDCLKKKKLKHIQSIHHKKPEAYGTNEEIKRSIKLYKAEIGE